MDWLEEIVVDILEGFYEHKDWYDDEEDLIQNAKIEIYKILLNKYGDAYEKEFDRFIEETLNSRRDNKKDWYVRSRGYQRDKETSEKWL